MSSYKSQRATTSVPGIVAKFFKWVLPLFIPINAARILSFGLSAKSPM